MRTYSVIVNQLKNAAPCVMACGWFCIQTTRIELTHNLAVGRAGATGRRVAAGQAPGSSGTAADTHLITLSAMGHVRLGMTLREARRALPGASIRRTSDGEGVALVQIAFGQHDSLLVWAEEDEPASPIDWSKRIVTIETFSAAFHTRQGIHPGSLVTDASRFLVRFATSSQARSKLASTSRSRGSLGH
jgi:hypothetical protein